MANRDLQTFIEQNAGKDFGGKYIFESIFLHTRYCLATEPHIVEVFMRFPWANFSDCFDDRDIQNNIDFYSWLVDKFFPLAEKRLTREVGNSSPIPETADG